MIRHIDRIVLAISKHIVAEDTLTCGSKHIGIEESTQFGIVITGLEIIQFGLCNSTLAIREKLGSF
jgi:hypothetical protein